MITDPLAPLRKELTLRCSVEHAFTVFTQEMGTWWPLTSHSISGDRARTATFEPRAGGRIFETDSEGGEHLWGQVTEWSPPHGIAFRWHPGGEPEQATQVAVHFESAGPDATVMVLVHSGWDARPDGAAARGGYDTGWDLVLEHYLTAAV